MKNFPVYQPQLVVKEREYINRCLNSMWISSRGKFILIFESAFSNHIGVNHATPVCNGIVELHLALLTLGIGKDDEVIVPTFTNIA